MPEFEYKLRREARDGAVEDRASTRTPSNPPSSPPPRHAIPSRVGDFTLLTEHQLEVAPYTRIVKWQSDRSGLKVVWADTPGPIARFWTTVNTEIFNSSGAPHTLEHLTFTASQNHPYSGFLDAVANRMCSQGTNAWTEVDNTTYTFESASAEGLLTVAPIFLDHILFPLFTEETFTTEVYHVDGNGEEGGVVFSEMQGREGGQGDVMDRAISEALYSSKNGYSSETGGQLDALRKIRLADIEKYHQRAYAPCNLTVLVTGQVVDPQKLLSTLSSTIEVAIARAGLAKGQRPRGWVRPFVESSTARSPPTLKRTVVKQVEYADSDESVGQIAITWIGPPVHDWLTAAALGALWTYLSGSSTSPLNQLFVEVEEPLCSDITFGSDFRNPTILTVSLSSVPKAHLSTLDSRFLDAVEHLLHEPFDMKRMATVLAQQQLGLLETLETDPAVYVQASVAQDMLYGSEDGSELKDAFGDLRLIRKLRKLTAEDWLDLLANWFVHRPSLTIIGTPSSSLATPQTAANAARVAATRKGLGCSGLAALDAALTAAKKANDHPAPPEVIRSFRMPDLRRVGLLESETARSNGAGRGRETYRSRVQDVVNQDVGDLPFFVQFDHFDSAFITVSVFLNGPPLPLFPLYLDCFFAMPVQRANGTLLSFEEANRQLSDLAVAFSAQTSGEGLLVSIKVVKQKYADAIVWLSDTLFDTQFDVDRLHNLLATGLSDLPAEKEGGMGVATAALDALCFSKASLNSPVNLLRRVELYPELQKRLLSDPKSVVKELEELRWKMLDPRCMRMHVSGDVLSLDRPASTWADHFRHVPPMRADQLLSVPRTCELLTEVGEKPAKMGVVYTLSSSESSYLVVRARAPTWTHPDHAAVRVAAACLSAENSYLWKAIRGPGLAYGATVSIDAEAGLANFVVFKSPNALAAFEEGKKVVERIASGETPITQLDVDLAKSSVVFNLVASQSTPASAASTSFYESVVLEWPERYAETCLRRIERQHTYRFFRQGVTLADVQRAIQRWLLPLFTPTSSIFAATANADKVRELVAGFSRLGWDVEKQSL
ncbi:hypothetical protein JCM8097_007588 [Rhodosporidiobolus ruineniae]